MKSSSDVFDAINSLERRFPVRAWRSGDIDLWPTYRIRLHGNAMDRILLNDAVKLPALRLREIATRISRALCRVPYATLRDWRRNAPVRRGTTAVFLSDGISFVQLGDTWFDRVIDPVMQALEARDQHGLKLTPLSEVHIPRYMPSRFIQLAVDRIKVSATYGRAEMETPEFEKVHKAAREFFDIAPSQSWLQIQAARLHALAKWFGRVFERSGATHAFVNTYYSLEGLAFVQAARRLGLLSVDLQHGIQGPHHVAYARWLSPPACGYSTLPDEFWVWGAEEASAIDAWRSSCTTHVPRISGNFWLQRWRDESDPLVARYLKQARGLRGSQPQALVCVAWGVPDEETVKLIEAAKLCGPSIAWWWRLHPVLARQSGEFARRLERHGLDGSQVRQATDLPLFALLRAADLTLTYSSTVIREAAELGVPSVVTSDYGAEMHSGLVGRGVVLHANDVSAIAAATKSLAARKRSASEPETVDRQSLQALVDTTFSAPLPSARGQNAPA
jgi:hypothetical protein